MNIKNVLLITLSISGISLQASAPEKSGTTMEQIMDAQKNPAAATPMALRWAALFKKLETIPGIQPGDCDCSNCSNKPVEGPPTTSAAAHKEQVAPVQTQASASSIKLASDISSTQKQD